MKRWFFLLGMVLGLGCLSAQAISPLTVAPGDLAIEIRPDGYHLWIRQLPGAQSVLLTEAFEPPEHKLATFAYRAVGPNPANDEEKRILDGKFLPVPHHSLISSTAVDYPGLGKAFLVVIPPTVEYGHADYPNSRYGKIVIPQVLQTAGQTFWFSIRMFAKPYGDYSGPYHESAFELKALIAQKAPPAPAPTKKPATYRSKDGNDGLEHLRRLLSRGGDSLDLVVAIATNKTMAPYLESLKTSLPAVLTDELKKFKSSRIGLVFYRDYTEDYLTRPVAFTSDLDQVRRDLTAAEAGGGGGLTMAVTEAMAAGLNNFLWTAASRLLIVVGDKPPHPTPRGTVTDAMVSQWADEKNVEIQVIQLPLITDPSTLPPLENP